MVEELWFDDCPVEDWTVVRPIMKRFQCFGILAVITGKVGQFGFLTEQQLKTMASEGWKIASHSVTHPRLPKLTKKQFLWELEASKKWIQTTLEVEPVAFVPPYSSITESQKKIALTIYPFVRKPNDPHFHSKWFLSPVDPPKKIGWTGKIECFLAMVHTRSKPLGRNHSM